MLADLREQREAIDQAIMVLERLALGQSKRRGRPPAWMASAVKATRQAAEAARIDRRMQDRPRSMRSCASLIPW
jgi:hypothetical protein